MEISKEAFFNYQVMIGLAEDVFNIKLPILGKKSNPTLDEVLKLAIDEKKEYVKERKFRDSLIGTYIAPIFSSKYRVTNCSKDPRGYCILANIMKYLGVNEISIGEINKLKNDVEFYNKYYKDNFTKLVEYQKLEIDDKYKKGLRPSDEDLVVESYLYSKAIDPQKIIRDIGRKRLNKKSMEALSLGVYDTKQSDDAERE